MEAGLIGAVSQAVVLRKVQQTQHLTWYFPRGLRVLIDAAGLSIVKESGRMSDLSYGTPIGGGGEMLFVCTAKTPL